MGTRCAPNVADIFMSFIDEEIKRRASKHGTLLFYRRFLDDILMIFLGSYKNLHNFISDINAIHPSIKFTLSHTKTATVPDDNTESCSCDASDHIPFLDTSLSIRGGKINSDLYRKPSDRVQYLLPTSCHPPHCADNIPYSLALRIIRICTDESERDLRLSELKEMLISRQYKRGLCDAAIEKALAVPRHEALKKVIRKKDNDRVVLAIRYHPKLPSATEIVGKHYRTMINSDPYLKEVFKKPPMIAYRRPKNLRDYLVRSKVPPVRPNRPRRQLKGMHKCRKPRCVTDKYVEEGKVVRSTATKKVVEINGRVNCNDSNVIYVISCKRCPAQYVGLSTREFTDRMGDHRGYVTNKHLDQPTGAHFNSRGHKLSDMKYTILEKVLNKDPMFLREREKMWIRKFNAKRAGMNKNY